MGRDNAKGIARFLIAITAGALAAVLVGGALSWLWPAAFVVAVVASYVVSSEVLG